MSIRRSVVAAVVAVALPALAPAQRAPAPSLAPSGWTVARDPFADLWFHTMAVVGDQGFGALPLYDAIRARSAPRRSRRLPAAEARLTRIHEQLAADSALELLHFVPMYFVGVAPTAALDALDDAAASRNPQASDRAHAVARAIVASLPTDAERRTLADVTAAARDEATALVPRRAAVDEANAAQLELLWSEEFMPVLGAYLARSGQTRGIILVAPMVGFDGRVVAIESFGTVVAVGPGNGSDPDAPLLSAVRELTYRALDRVPVPHEGRVAAEKRRDVLAVRAGAMLLEANPRLAEQYRAWYRAIAPFPFLAFEQLYPIDPPTERALRAALVAPGIAQR